MDEESSMKSNLEINKKDGCILISVNPKFYPVDVVMSVAYIFTDKNYILVDGDPSEEIIVEIHPKENTVELENIGREFNNELINYASYAIQAIKNSKIREAIMKRVTMTNAPKLDNASVTNQEVSDEAKLDTDFDDEEFEFDDPEGIAIPWEEKYGKDKDKQGE